METLKLQSDDLFSSTYGEMKVIREDIEKAIERGTKSVLTNLQLASVIQDVFATVDAKCSVPRTLEVQQGPYLFLEYNNCKFFVDPYMSWNDTRLLYFDSVDMENVNKDMYASYSKKVETNNTLI